MYTHKVTIVRPDKTNPFFYHDLYNDGTYALYSQKYKDEGRLISESMEESADGLSLTRTLVFSDKASYEEMLTGWASQNPFYTKRFIQYVQQVRHQVSFDAFES